MTNLENKISQSVSQDIIDRLKVYANMVKTRTYVNGKGFADHARIDAELGSTDHFADPFASLQRGSNEKL